MCEENSPFTYVHEIIGVFLLYSLKKSWRKFSMVKTE